MRGAVDSSHRTEILGLGILVLAALVRAGASLGHGWLLVAVIAFACAVALGLGGWLARRGGPRLPSRSHWRQPLRHRGAHWAAPSDLRPLRVQGPDRGRLVLGRTGRQLIAAEPSQSVIVIGPSQSKKTSGIAIPAILEWDGPVLATSVKTDLVRDTMEWRRTIGDVLVYDPAGATGLPAAGWSPLAASSTWAGARRVAAGLCSVARSRSSGMEDSTFWYAMAEKLLAPMLLAASTAGASMADVVRWIDAEEVVEVELALQLAGVPEAIRAAAASFGREERQKGSIYATAESVIEAFADPSVSASACSHDITAGRLLDGGRHSLYLCAPAHEQERLQPVFVTVVRQMLEEAFAKSAAAGRPLDPPLLVVLDEAANVAPVTDLDKLASTAAGHGIQLVTVFQDMAQIEARYGHRAGTVVNNHRAKVVLSGISDPATLEHVSRLAGDEELWMPSTTVDAEGRRSRTDSPITRPLAPAASLRRIAPGQGVLIYGHLPPVRLNLRPWFEDRELGERVRAGASTFRGK